MLRNIIPVKSLLGFICLMGAVVFGLSGGALAAGDTYRMKIVVFGDSIVSGERLLPEETFSARLQRRLQTVGYDVQVIDMTNSGDTTSTAVGRVGDVLRVSPDLVLIAFGLNDTERGIDTTLIYNNLYKITYSFLKTVSGVDSDIYAMLVGMQVPATREYEYRAQVENNFEALAERLVVSFYPSVLDGVAGVPALSMADGLHPNAEGVNVMVENLLPMIDNLLRYRLQGLAKRNAEFQRRQGY